MERAMPSRRKYRDQKFPKNQKSTSNNKGVKKTKKLIPTPPPNHPTLVLLPNGKKRFIFDYEY